MPPSFGEQAVRYWRIHVLNILAIMMALPATAQEPVVRTCVSIPPQSYLAEHIGGEHVAVQTLIQSGQDPHLFEPTPRQVAALSKARLYFEVGTLPFEKRLVQKLKASTASLTVVNTSAGLGEGSTHTHEHTHETECTEPHIWLGPRELRVQARNMARALAKAAPTHEKAFRANLAAFEKALDTLDAHIRQRLAPWKGQSIFVFHPAFGHFLDTYGLKQVAVETAGKRPTPKQIQSIVRQARASDVKVIFVQPQFDQRSASAIAQAIGATLVPLDPLKKDILQNLEAMAVAIEQTFTRHKLGAP